jgi:hypothetical protein
MRRTFILGSFVAACAPSTTGFVVDATDLAARFPGTVLRTDVVLDAEAVLSITQAVDEEPVVRIPDALTVGVLYGVAAYLDLDGDGVCSPDPTDRPWFFYLQPGYAQDVTWVPDTAESPEMAAGCSWFGTSVTPDPELPGDSGLILP